MQPNSATFAVSAYNSLAVNGLPASNNPVTTIAPASTETFAKCDNFAPENEASPAVSTSSGQSTRESLLRDIDRSTTYLLKLRNLAQLVQAVHSNEAELVESRRLINDHVGKLYMARHVISRQRSFLTRLSEERQKLNSSVFSRMFNSSRIKEIDEHMNSMKHDLRQLESEEQSIVWSLENNQKAHDVKSVSVSQTEEEAKLQLHRNGMDETKLERVIRTHEQTIAEKTRKLLSLADAS